MPKCALMLNHLEYTQHFFIHPSNYFLFLNSSKRILFAPFPKSACLVAFLSLWKSCFNYFVLARKANVLESKRKVTRVAILKKVCTHISKTNSFCLHFILQTCLMSIKEILISWDSTLHMAIHERMKELTDDCAELRGRQMFIWDKLEHMM